MCGGMRTSLKFLENVDGFYTTVTDTPNRIPAKMSIPKIDHFRFLCRQPNLGFWSGEKTTTPENVSKRPNFVQEMATTLEMHGNGF